MVAPGELLKLLLSAFLYVLAAGGYALFLALFQLSPLWSYRLLAGLFLALLLVSAAFLIASPALSPFWKGLLLLTTGLYLLLPPASWWLAVRFHR